MVSFLKNKVANTYVCNIQILPVKSVCLGPVESIHVYIPTSYVRMYVCMHVCVLMHRTYTCTYVYVRTYVFVHAFLL